MLPLFFCQHNVRATRTSTVT